MSHPAVFIDKDGTLVENIPHNVDPARIRLMPGVSAGLRALAKVPHRLFIVSNQPGLALGLFDEAAFLKLARWLETLFETHGCRLAGLYFCPHHPAGAVPRFAADCRCRKPQPGLIYEAAAEHDLDLARSWMIGDILNDIEAGRRAGCRAILVDCGNETEWRWNPERRPHAAVARFDDAVRTILDAEARELAHDAMV